LTKGMQSLKAALRDAFARLVMAWTALRWSLRNLRGPGRPSGLGRPVVISLTSYPPRFKTLLPTLQSLLMQTVAADHVELWIAEADMAKLPESVLALRDAGLSIRSCPDLRSYKKIIPALAAHPDAIIVTADDDAYYWPDWLAELVAAYDPDKNEVLCHRAHQMVVDGSGNLTPYREWRFETPDNKASRSVFPTGLGGVMYRPGIFAGDIARKDLFQSLCPTADDVWLYWMASLNQARFRKVGTVKRFILWPGGQEVALFNHNVVGDDANDRQIRAMIEAYGLPAADGRA